jgi:Papain family cysteine protease
MSDRLNPPDHMSLPKAAAFPVTRLGFAYTACRRLLAHGIVSALQLAEIASRAPHQLKHLTGISPTKARRILEAELGILPDFTRRAVSFDPLPPGGVPVRHDLPVASPPDTGDGLTRHLADLPPLPTKVDLGDRMQPVGNQGPHPTCVGWATSAVREFHLGRAMSAGYAYRGAKSRDGWTGPGSWQRFAFEHFFQTGHVEEPVYPYTSAIRELPIAPFDEVAAIAKASGFANLPVQQPTILPQTIKAVLAGRFSPLLGPQPVAVSLMICPSFTSTSTALDGLIPMPLPGEQPAFGHAMVITGYFDAADPENPFGIDYFLVRNSWGTIWASENPFNRPGHALVPTKYLATPNLTSEAIICLT